MYKKIIIIALCLLAFLVRAEDKLLPLEVYAKQPNISLMSISPDGSRIAYRLMQKERDLLVVKSVDTGEVLGGAGLEGINSSSTYFLDNHRVILRASEYKSVQGYKGKFTVSTAFIFDVRTKEIRQLLIPGYGIYRGQSGLGNIVGLSQDKETAYMPAYYAQELGSLRRGIGAEGSNPLFTLMKVSLTKKKLPKQYRIGKHDAIDFFVDDNGNPIARERYNDSTNIHSIQSYIDDEWVDVFSEETPYRTKGFVGLTADRKSLVMTATGKNGRINYFTMSLENGDLSESIFTRDDADVEEVLTDIQRVVYGVKYSGFKPSYEFFDKELTKTLNMIQSAMPNNAFTMIDHTPDWSKIIFQIAGDGQPEDYFLFANNRFNFLVASRPHVSPEQVHSVKEYYYNARDGLNIPTLLTYPKGGIDKNLPAVVLPHGGPESYDKIHFHWLAQYIASRGALVIQPQFRGSNGFGISHIWEGRGEWGQKMQDDLTDSITALSKEGIIDSERVCIIGASYGGYAALAGAALTPELYKCTVSINGLSDIGGFLDDEKFDHGRKSEIYAYWKQTINKKGLGADFIDSISPIHSVKKIKAPILLIHAKNDQVVPFEQSEDFYDELEDMNKTAQFIEIEGDGHYFWKNESRIKTLEAIDVFLDKHLFN